MLGYQNMINNSNSVISYSPNTGVTSSPVQNRPHDLQDSVLDIAVPSPFLRMNHAGLDSDAASIAAFSPTCTGSDSIPDTPDEANATDIVGEIAFRSPFTRTSVRTLYTPGSGRPMSTSDRFRRRPESPGFPFPQDNLPTVPSPIRTTVTAHQIGIDSRRGSLVNPEDYMPGLPSGMTGGKAMAAGFDPVRPHKVGLL